MEQKGNKTQNKSQNKQIHAEIRLPYFKQGDDLAGCIFKNEDGSINSKKTLEDHINLLECAVEQLREINNCIPEINNVVLDGDTHYIGISGDERVINILIEKELAFLPDYDDSNDSNDDSIEYCDDDVDGDVDVDVDGDGDGDGDGNENKIQ